MKMTYLNEAKFISEHSVDIQHVFNKIDLYNKTLYRKNINERYYNDILFTLNEQEAIKGMFMYMQQQILESYLNEINWGGLKDKISNTANNIKQSVSNAADKVSQKIDNIADILKNAPAKVKQAYEFCEKIIKAGITKVSEFIKKVLELFQQLGDNLREAIIKLGGFGKDEEEIAKEVSESEEIVDLNNVDPFNGINNKDEKTFLQYILEYVKMKNGKLDETISKKNFTYFDYGYNDTKKLNEGVLDKMHDFFEKHPVLSKIVIGKYNGQKVHWFKSILISICGSILLSIVIPAFLTVFGMAAETAGMVGTVLLLVWAGRGVIRTLLNRNEQMKHSSGPKEKFLNAKTAFLLLLQIGTAVLFQMPTVKAYVSQAL